MRRAFRNTTAIAACLALLVPNVSAAQVAAEAEAQVVPPAPQDTPAEAAPDQSADEQPAPDAAADDQAQADQPAAAEPVEAEASPDPAAAPDEATEKPADELAQEPSGDEPAPADSEATTAETAPAATDEPVEPADASDLDAAMEAEADNSADAEPVATDPDAGVTAETPADAAPEQSQEAPPTAAETAAETEPSDQADPATEPAAETVAPEGETDLDAAMAAEQEAQDSADPATADAPQEAEPEAEQPTSDAPTDSATQDEPQSEAAAEAAAATETPNVTALDDDATAEVTEEQVTEENSRSSAEDFATTMRDAVSAGENDTQARDDSDDDNDLTKAILLGLGGVAVGAMLSNNRQVELSTPDRIVVTRPDGTQQLIKDDVALLRQPGSTVATENFDDGSSRTIVTRADGSRIVTIRDADLRVLRRTLVSADGTQTRLIDETVAVEPVDIANLPRPAPAYDGAEGDMDEAALRAALMREAQVDRRFSLSQIRDIPQVRSLVAPIDVNGITFDTNSAAIDADQAKQLTALGNVIRDAIAENPSEIFLIEGHTDTVGNDAANLALSDRRAESVALALTEYFDVAPENMVVQGYGEQSLKVQQEGDVRENRRVAVRRITELLQTASN